MRHLNFNLVLIFLVFGFCAALASGLAARAYWHKPSEHLLIRTETISDQVRQAVDRDMTFAAIVGNSLSERLYLDEVCGLPAINAGVSRARIAEVAEIARIVRASGAAVRVLSIGVNDIARGAEPDDFATDYARLVGIYEPHVVVGVTGDLREPYNSIIRDLAGEAIYVEPLDSEFLQADGVHYTSRGADRLAGLIDRACAQASLAGTISLADRVTPAGRREEPASR